MLDYHSLRLKPFYAGALVRSGGGWHRVADPLRHPLDGVMSLGNPVGTPLDKIRVGLLRWVNGLFFLGCYSLFCLQMCSLDVQGWTAALDAAVWLPACIPYTGIVVCVHVCLV